MFKQVCLLAYFVQRAVLMCPTYKTGFVVAALQVGNLVDKLFIVCIRLLFWSL